MSSFTFDVSQAQPVPQFSHHHTTTTGGVAAEGASPVKPLLDLPQHRVTRYETAAEQQRHAQPSSGDDSHTGPASAASSASGTPDAFGGKSPQSLMNASSTSALGAVSPLLTDARDSTLRGYLPNDRRAIFAIDRADVVHIPLAVCGQATVPLCHAFAASGSCPAGEACPRVHATLRHAKQFTSHIRDTTWKTHADVPFELYDASLGTARVYLPSRRDMAEMVALDTCIKTHALIHNAPPGSHNDRAPTPATLPPVLSHCSHFLAKGECHMGSNCRFLHCALPSAFAMQHAPQTKKAGMVPRAGGPAPPTHSVGSGTPYQHQRRSPDAAPASHSSSFSGHHQHHHADAISAAANACLMHAHATVAPGSNDNTPPGVTPLPPATATMWPVAGGVAMPQPVMMPSSYVTTAPVPPPLPGAAVSLMPQLGAAMPQAMFAAPPMQAPHGFPAAMPVAPQQPFAMPAPTLQQPAPVAWPQPQQ